jgi:hypothetical protein
MRDAFGVYLGAVYPAVAGLRELPDVHDPPALDGVVNRLRGEAATVVATRKRERNVFGDSGPRELGHRVAIATAGLQVLPLPDEVRATLDQANDYLERLSERRTVAIKAEWPDIHQRLMAAAELLRFS